MVASNFTGVSDSYIFDNAGGKRDQLEQAVLQELSAKDYPLKYAVQTLSTGLIFTTKEQCIVIDGGKTFEIIVANSTIGSYLYVEVYLNVKQGLFGAKKLSTTDVFANMKQFACYAAAKDAVESAFTKLQLKQSNHGYTSKQNVMKSDK